MRDDRDPSDGEKPQPYWLLISVLFSTQPLSDALARLLYESAFELYRTDRGAGELRGAMVQGTLENLRSNASIGALSGPTFEARIDTERGAGTVRFLLTWKAIEWLARRLDGADAAN